MADARFCVRCGVPLAAPMQTAVPRPTGPVFDEVTQPYAAPQPHAHQPYASQPFGQPQPYAPPQAYGPPRPGGPHAPGYPPQQMPTQRGLQHQPWQPRQGGGNPVLASILSVIIPGLGQLYNSDVKKGLVMFAIAFFGIALFGLGWLAMMIWGAIDAYQVASGTGRRWS